MRICRSIYLRGRIWWGRYRVPGNPLRQISLETEDKHVAEKKLADAYSMEEQEKYGIIPPRQLRESAFRGLSVHLQEYLANLRTMGRVDKYVSDTETRISAVISGCEWETLSDVNTNDFTRWRSRQRLLSPSSLNAYRGAFSAFFEWLLSDGRVAGNPFARVQRVETRGRERRVRRALQLEELRRLCAATDGHRSLVYFFAAYTGLRRREVRLLRWADLDLDGATPFVRVRAANAKNKKDASIPLHPALVSALLSFRAQSVDLSGSVFSTMPTAATVNADFKRVGIVKRDGEGRVVDFHSFRGTFATLLNLQGVTPRSAMELMRHSDMRLTHKVYTDASVLPLAVEVRKLPVLTCGT